MAFKTSKQQIGCNIDNELYEKIVTFQDENGIQYEAEAIRQLIGLGFQKYTEIKINTHEMEGSSHLDNIDLTERIKSVESEVVKHDIILKKILKKVGLSYL